MPFRYLRRVAFAETDLTGGLHFANLLRYFEEAEQALFRSLGIPLLWRGADGLEQGWPRVSAECELREPIGLAEELEVFVQITQVRHSSLRLAFEVRRLDAQPDSLAVARGTLRLACIAARPGQPLRAAAIPEEMLQKLLQAVEAE